jgi:hypothetical protein
MSVHHLKRLTAKLDGKDTTSSYTVLDGGLVTVLVLTTDGKWWLLHSNQWMLVDETRAKELCENHYKAYRFQEMKDTLCIQS